MHKSAHSIKAKRRLPSILRYARRRLCGATRLFARRKATLPCTFVLREDPSLVEWKLVVFIFLISFNEPEKTTHSYLFCCGCTLIRHRRGTVSAGLQF